MKTVKKATEILLSVLLWAIILIMALFTFTTLATKDNKSVSRVAGFTPLIVRSQSMAPTFNEGDLIIIKSVNVAKLVTGDIITFHTIINNEYALNTHRIENITENGGIRSYVTKGDNNAIADTHMISDGDIVGKYVTRLPGVGKFMDFLSSSTGFLLVIVLPMLLFFVYQVYHLINVSINLKKAIAAEEATEASQKEAEADAKMAQAEAAMAEVERMKREMEEKLAQAGMAQKTEEATTEESGRENNDQ